MPTKTEYFVDELEIMLKANMTPWVITHEEERFLKTLRKLAPRFQGDDFRILVWSLSEGLFDYTPYVKPNASGKYGKPQKVIMNMTQDDPFLKIADSVQTEVNTFNEFLEYAREQGDNALFIVKDIYHVIHASFPQIRRFRDLIQIIRNQSTWLLTITTGGEVPGDLEKELHQIEMALPDSAEINALLDTALNAFAKLGATLRIPYKDAKGKSLGSSDALSIALRDRIVFNLLGLTEVEISQVLTYTCVKNHGVTEDSLQDIKDMKRQLIENSGSLEFISTPDVIHVGGHDRFKAYVEERGLYLDKNFREKFNLKAPKGVCLVGPPGSAKSLFARYIGHTWQLPLIRVDMGAIYGSKLGESEGRLRNALRIAEANAPCILWIDEVEKALGGASGDGEGVSGTVLRVFGKLLTWMTERKEMVFLYCTANNLDAIPPEFQRAGRLDSLWWTDLAVESDCKEIVRIHAAANKITLSDIECATLAKEASGNYLTGAEIEHAILEALYKAAAKGKLLKTDMPVSVEIIKLAMDDIRPYAKSHQDVLKKSRLSALQKFEFTSTEARKYVEQNMAAVTGEWTDSI